MRRHTSDTACETVPQTESERDTEVETGSKSVDSWAALRERETSVIHAYRDESILRYLYRELGWTAADIGARYAVDQSTVNRWLRRHDIPTRPPAPERQQSDSDDVDTADGDRDGDVEG